MKTITMPDTWDIQITMADAYNGPDKTEGVNVNTGAIFIRSHRDGYLGDWYRVTETKNQLKAERILLECLGMDDAKEKLGAVALTPAAEEERRE